MPRPKTNLKSKTTPKTKTFDFKIQKNNSHINVEDLEKWIKAEIKGKWNKRTNKHNIAYTFTTMDDAFKFMFRWTFS